MTALLDNAELMIRSGAAVLNLFIAAQLARTRPIRFVTAAGILFCLGISSYTLAPALARRLGPAGEVLIVLAVLNPVFLWWFALALFRDVTTLRLLHAAPLVLFLAFCALRYVWIQVPSWSVIGPAVHQLAVAAILVHIVSLALIDLPNDLVDARRRFRAAIAIVLPLVGLIITAAEIYSLLGELPAWLSPIHAVALLALSFLFALWLTETRTDLIAPPSTAPQAAAGSLAPADLVDLDRLKVAIGRGVCLQPDLSLGALARELNMPEHRLRRLIGKGLGYRNFSAFLNDHRIAEARRLLADPARSREQIASVAYGLGYSSLAPFNRAFRQLTGLSPSEYRAQALSRPIDSEKV